MRCLISLVLLLGGAVAQTVEQPATSQRSASGTADPRIRGVTISTHGNGNDWAGDRIGEACADARGLGANWIAIHPYARITQQGDVQPWQGKANPEPIARPVREAHARGLKVLIVPHLAQWGSGFRWRGDIKFADDAQWARFFAGYGQWLAEVAAIAHDADAIAVGSELDATITHANEWRSVVAGVRAQTRAPLTYAANWTDYQRVTFWDALDAVGIDAYFPLVDDTIDKPTRQDLERGWAARMREIAAYSRKMDRCVVFTELGYNRAWRTAHTPWDSKVDGSDAETLQTMCLDVALRAVENEPCVVGSFLWKWFPPPRRAGRDFQLATEANMQVIRAAWRYAVTVVR